MHDLTAKNGAMRHTHDVIVIGAGAAGLTAAGGCAMYGLKVALIERGRMGGECLNTGCVPSKALLAATHRAQAVRTAAHLGIITGEPRIDFAAVHAHVQAAIARIAPHDARERFEAMGVDVIAGEARFVSPHGVRVGERTLSAPRIVIATGSRPRLPDIPGLAETPHLTNETIFDLTQLPDHLVILGGGAIGVEMAQAFRRLGAAVTLVEADRPLAHEDADAAALLLDTLRAEGVRILAGTPARRIAATATGIEVTLGDGQTIAASHLLVATGRAPDLASLGLAAAGVTVGEDGIVVDAYRRTSARHILAIGDCRAGPRLTHVAGHEGTLALRRVALGLSARANYSALPRAIYTEPELAQVGLTEADARATHGDVVVTTTPFADDDRALAENDAAGFVKLVRARGRVVGVTIVGTHAGEQLLPWSQILARHASAFALAGTIVAYPTRSEASKAAAFESARPLLFHPALKRWAALLAWARRA